MSNIPQISENENDIITVKSNRGCNYGTIKYTFLSRRSFFQFILGGQNIFRKLE